MIYIIVKDKCLLLQIVTETNTIFSAIKKV